MTDRFAELVARAIEETLPAREAVALAKHLSGCEACRKLSAEIARNDDLLSLRERVIELDPLAPNAKNAGAHRLRIGLLLATTILMLIVAVGVGQFLAGRHEQPSAATASAAATSAGNCSAPPRPQYLPFPASAPTESTYEDGARGLRYYATNAQPSLPVYAFIGHQRNPPGWAGAGHTVQAGRRTVNVIWGGDPGVGEITSYWTEGSGSCTVFTTSLVLRTGTPAQIEAELLKVIASLPVSP